MPLLVKVLPITVAVPKFFEAAAAAVGGVAGENAVADRQRPRSGEAAAAAEVGGVAGEGAAAHRCRRATLVVKAAAAVAAELLEKTLLLTVNVPKLSRPPPWSSKPALPPVIVIPEMDAVTFGSTRNTRLFPLNTAVPAAVDRHARLRARDRLCPGRVVQLELGAVQGDRLRRLEHRFVKGDGLGRVHVSFCFFLLSLCGFWGDG